MVRNLGRLLAPIAIAAVAVGTYVIVESNTGSRHAARTVQTTTVRHVRHDHRTRTVTSRPTSYVVRSGDTLSAIASRTGVALSRLEGLNPSLAPSYTLHTGERLRLRR